MAAAHARRPGGAGRPVLGALHLELAPCGSCGRLGQQGLPGRHPRRYGGWSDGVSSFCRICKANPAAVAFLCGPEAGCITGAGIDISGGGHLHTLVLGSRRNAARR